MRIAETIDGVTAFEGRGAGTDAERRAAAWLSARLREGRREVAIETFWCRPNWPLAQAWHVALALAGSLLAVAHPRAGAVLVLLALLFVIADAAFGMSPGRRLTRERASQNVIAHRAGASGRRDPAQRPQLILTANIDAGRAGLVHRDALRGRTARLRRLTGGRAPGWAAWLCVAIIWVLATALLRVEDHKATAVAVAQVIPTIALVVALALLLDLATADWSPAANDNASGVATAVAVADALDAAPPAALDVTLVVTGAGDGQGIGLRRYLRARRHALRPANAIVLGIGPCGSGRPVWLASDGPLVPLAFFGQLRRLAATAAATDPTLGLEERRSRGTSPALPGRAAGLPSITLACIDAAGRPPRSHQRGDTADRIETRALESTLQAALLLVDAIDAFLYRQR